MIIETQEGRVELRRSLFWDINENNIGHALLESDEWVIPRVFEYGTLEEISELINYYGRKKTIEVLTNLKDNLKPVTKAMAWYYFDLEL
ncbi:MAG: hypothetical protein WAU36_04105 [Cyclobacteriaceae bacterium]